MLRWARQPRCFLHTARGARAAAHGAGRGIGDMGKAQRQRAVARHTMPDGARDVGHMCTSQAAKAHTHATMSMSVH